MKNIGPGGFSECHRHRFLRRHGSQSFIFLHGIFVGNQNSHIHPGRVCQCNSSSFVVCIIDCRFSALRFSMCPFRESNLGRATCAFPDSGCGSIPTSHNPGPKKEKGLTHNKVRFTSLRTDASPVPGSAQSGRAKVQRHTRKRLSIFNPASEAFSVAFQ